MRDADADLQGRLAAGWNTWNTRSVLSHVLLPEGVAVNLGFKHYAAGDYLKESLIGRQGEHEETIHPGLRTYDGGYTELRLTWKGTAWTVQSAVDGEDLLLLVTPYGEPAHVRPLVVTELGLLWGRRGSLGCADEVLTAVTPGGKDVRVYATAAGVAEPYIQSQCPSLAIPADRPAGFATGRPRTVAEIQAVMSRQRAARLAEDATWGDLAEVRNAMQTCLAWDTVYDPLHDRVVSPVSRIWNCNWGGYVLFCWDSYFAAAMAAVDNKDLAYANAIAVTREGIASGFVPNFVSPSGFQSRDRSQPPVGALTVMQIYRRHKDVWFLEALFDDLLVWNRWWPQARDVDGLLCWGSHPYAPVTGNGGENVAVDDRQGAAYESGLDNAPMYDDIPFDSERHVLCLQDVGLNGLYVADCEALAEMAGILGREAEAAELTARADTYRAAMQRLWDEKTGLFLNRRTDTGAFDPRLAPTHFYPLLAGAASPEQAQRMINEHFFNPDEFAGEWILPSCARNDPAYPEQTYWRGRIWAPMNWLVYLGLRRYGMAAAQRELADKSRSLLLKEWREHGHVHENYCAETGQGCNRENSDAFYHWGGLLGLIAIEEAGGCGEAAKAGRQNALEIER